MKHLIYELSLQHFDHKEPSKGFERQLETAEYECQEMSKKLMELLPDTSKELLTELEEKHNELEWRYGMNFFADGFSLGIKLILGALS